MAKTIFCVDDDETLADIVAARLKSQGYEALAFKDADEAVEAIGKTRPDLILLDKTMSTQYGEDGIDVCKKIRTLPGGKQIKIIILSGLIDDGDRVRGKKVGVDDYVCKPFQSQRLFEIIENLLKS